jgi:hypothetical protein
MKQFIPLLVLIGLASCFGTTTSVGAPEGTDAVCDRLKLIVAKNGGNFDRFLNSFLESGAPDLEVFKKVSQVGALFDVVIVERGLKTLTRRREVGRTPFHDFADYFAKVQPLVHRISWLSSIDQTPKPCLAKVDRVVTKQLPGSIVLSQSDIDTRATDTSILVGGGDVRVKVAEGTVILAAGDVTIAGESAEVFVIAGGKITVAGPLGDHFLVAGQKVEIEQPRFIRQAKNKVVSEAQGKGGAGLFADLADYGLKAVRDGGKVRIQIVKNDSPFRNLLKEQDRILKVAGKDVESVGQFRRLMSHALETHRLDVELERAEKNVRVQSKLTSE